MSIYIPYYKPNKKFMQTSIAKLVDMIKVRFKTTEVSALFLLVSEASMRILLSLPSKIKAPAFVLFVLFLMHTVCSILFF